MVEESSAVDFIDQGDLLFDCPILQFSPSAPFPVPDDEVPGVRINYDVIVLTQICDLAQNKVSNVLVCRHEPAALVSKSRQSEVIKGRQPRYAMLEKSSFSARPMEQRIVDLSDVFQVPLSWVQKVAAAQTPRLRLLPPYREHISQAFALFYMRIGFPQDIRLD